MYVVTYSYFVRAHFLRLRFTVTPLSHEVSVSCCCGPEEETLNSKPLVVETTLRHTCMQACRRNAHKTITIEHQTNIFTTTRANPVLQHCSSTHIQLCVCARGVCVVCVCVCVCARAVRAWCVRCVHGVACVCVCVVLEASIQYNATLL